MLFNKSEKEYTLFADIISSPEGNYDRNQGHNIYRVIFMLYIIFFSIVSYLIGSLNTAIIISKKFYKQDIRNLGSLNAGASNAVRSLGKKAGAIVFLIDFLKGFLLVETLIISLITAPVLEVRTPIVFGINGIFFLCFSSKFSF